MKQGKKENSNRSTIYRVVWEVFLIREYFKSRLERSEGANYVDIGGNSNSDVENSKCKSPLGLACLRKRKEVSL